MDRQYLTTCTTHLGVSDVVKPVSKAWEGSAFLKGACFPSLLPFYICFSLIFDHPHRPLCTHRLSSPFQQKELSVPDHRPGTSCIVLLQMHQAAVASGAG